MQMGSLRAGASRFAHLAGLGRASRRADEDNEDRHDTGAKKKGRRADEEDDDQRADGDAPESGDDGSTDSGGLNKKGSRAEEDDPDGDDGNADDDDKPAGKKSKRSRRADDEDDEEPAAKRSRRADDGDDDDDDEEDDDKREMSGRGTVPSARRRERSRCAAIFAHPAAGANPELAASLAFETTMTRREAIAVLRGQSGRPTDRSYRSSRNPSLGSEGKVSGVQAIQASWDRAFKKVGGRG